MTRQQRYREAIEEELQQWLGVNRTGNMCIFATRLAELLVNLDAEEPPDMEHDPAIEGVGSPLGVVEQRSCVYDDENVTVYDPPDAPF